MKESITVRILGVAKPTFIKRKDKGLKWKVRITALTNEQGVVYVWALGATKMEAMANMIDRTFSLGEGNTTRCWEEIVREEKTA